MAATALGLFAYAVWRLYEATKNPASKKAIVRLGYAGSGLLYGSMGVSAVLLATTGGGGSNGGGTQSAVAEALQQPFGKIIVGIAALVVIGKAFYQFYRAFTGNLDSGLYLPKNQSKLVFRAAVFGFAARGVVLAVVGYFFVRAALHENSGEARDTKGVFTFLESGFGPWLLGIVAFGLVCYGVFMMVRARYGSFEVQ